MTTHARKRVLANWKANKTLSQARQWAEKFLQQELRDDYEYVVCPPFPHLSAIATEFPQLTLAVQDLSTFEAGPYTGEVPGYVLQDLQVRYAILGHSERRKYQHETSALVAAKAEIALSAGITPVICVDREEFENQLDQLDAKVRNNSVFAYEPVHAISSFGGHEDPLEITLETIDHLRRVAGSHVPVLYGGSVDPDNSLMYLQRSEIDGVLVGKASLDAEVFARL